MVAEIVIVSGFLGAGKTTLIQQWLDKGVFSGKTAIIENDFGGAGVDAALLRSGDVTVTELSEGCICCSLAGDFVRALEELTAQYAPDTILIEPSGVGMLSDVRRACSHPRIAPLARVRCAVTIVDIRRMSRYQASFGVFYEDQIRRADAIVLSRVEQHPELTVYFAPGPRIGSIPANRLQRLLALRPLIHLNASEALTITGRSSLPKAVQDLCALSCGRIIVTLGARGVLCAEGEHSVLVPGELAAVQDTIGAGDSHIGAMIAGLARGLSTTQAAANANRFAAAVVNNPGAILPRTVFETLKCLY